MESERWRGGDNREVDHHFRNRETECGGNLFDALTFLLQERGLGAIGKCDRVPDGRGARDVRNRWNRRHS